MKYQFKQKISILVSSYDGASDLWEAFFYFFELYFPDNLFQVYLITNKKTFQSKKYLEVIHTNEKESWSDNLLFALDKVQSEYVLYMQDDYFLDQKVNLKLLIKGFDFMLKKKAAYLRLMPSPEPDLLINGNKYIGKISKKAPYKTALQAAIWQKEQLKLLLRKGESGWDFEERSPKRSLKISQPFLSFTRFSLPLKYFFIEPYKNVFLTAVNRGYILTETLKFFENNGFKNFRSERKTISSFDFVNLPNKKKNNSKKVLLSWLVAFLSLGFLILSLSLCFFVAENWFFDKLLYKKSVFHGYFNLNYFNFYRSIGLLNQEYYRDKNLKPKNKNEYTILIIGDSNVFGSGVRLNQRFTNILEKKLDKIRRTSIINAGRGGDNFLNYMTREPILDETLNPDLIIYIIWENDLLIYEDQLDMVNKYFSGDELSIQSSDSSTYGQDVISSFKENSKNFALFEYLVPKLNRDNLYYHITYFEPTYHDYVLEDVFRKNDIDLINNFELFETKYKNLKIKNNFKKTASLAISDMEGHPNSTAHKMFAERLYLEITSNSKYRFFEQ